MFDVGEAVMPTVLRSGAYRIFFFAADGNEPPHVHLERESKKAKVWLSPVRSQESGGYGESELNRIVSLIEAHQERLLGAWYDFFNG
jgi:hypothetical protein